MKRRGAQGWISGAAKSLLLMTAGALAIAALPLTFARIPQQPEGSDVRTHIDASPATLFATSYALPVEETPSASEPAHAAPAATPAEAASAHEEPAAADDPPAAPPAEQAAPHTPPSPPPASEPSPQTAAPAPVNVQFNFKGATFDQVLDYFSRVTGLPVVRETDVPQGTLDYLSPESYELPEALRILNILLQSRGVMLRQDGNMLYLQKLTEMQRENIPTYIGELPGQVSDEQIVTVVLPLRIALAKTLAEKFKTMVAEYGAVTPMEQQNALVITETASQIRRLQRIIEELDREDPEGAIEIFQIKHANAKALMEPLKALLSQKEVKYVINQQGEQVKLEENTMPGLALTADERTNAIVAKGLQQRIDKLREAINLLDVPGTANARSVKSFALSAITPADAVNRLNALFAKLPEDQRPVVMPAAHDNRVTVVGAEAPIAEAEMLLKEIDGEVDPSSATRLVVQPLMHVRPDAAVNTLRALLTPRQAQSVKLMPGLDGKSIILGGPASDVESITALLPAIDTPAKQDRQIRLVRISAPDAASAVKRAKDLHATQAQAMDPPDAATVEFDAESRLATVMGTADAVARFLDTLRQVEATVVIEREVRRFELANTLPSRIAPSLSRLAVNLTMPTDGRASVPPTFEAIDDLNVMLVTATHEQLEVIAPLVMSLDSNAATGERDVRVFVIGNTDANQLANTLRAIFAERDQRGDPPTIQVDAASNTLIARGTADQLATIERVAKEVDQAAIVSSRQIRMLPVDPAKASARDIAEALEQLLQSGKSGRVEVISIEELRQRRESASEPKKEARRGAIGNAQGPLASAMTLLASAAIGQTTTDDAKAKEHDAEPEITVAIDEATNSLVIIGSERAVNRAASLAQQIQDRLPAMPGAVRYITLDEGANAQAVANLLTQTIERLSANQGAGAISRRVAVLADQPNNAIILVCNDADFATVGDILAAITVASDTADLPLTVIELESMRADQAASLLTQLLVASDRSRRKNTLIVPSNDTGQLLVRAPENVVADIRSVLGEIDRKATTEFPVRTIVLQRADAPAVASAVQRFYDDRARIASVGRGRAAQSRRISIVGDSASNTLLIAASDEDYAEIESLVKQFDTPEATSALTFRVFQLRHAKASDIADTVEGLISDITWNQGPIAFWGGWFGGRQDQSRGRGTLAVRADDRLNALIVTGEGDKFAVVEQLIDLLDAPPPEGEERVARLYHVKHADVGALSGIIEDTYGVSGASRRWWEPASPTDVKVRSDNRTKTIIIYASARQHEEIAALISNIDGQVAPADQQVTVIAVEYAHAADVARTLTEFLRSQARATGAAAPAATITASPSANRLIVAAPDDELALIRDLVSKIDRSDVTDDRTIEIIALTQGQAQEIARIVGQHFRGGGGQGVIITPDARTNSLIVNAPKQEFPAVEALITQLDGPSSGDETIIRTYTLDAARADEAVRILSQTLQLDARGRTAGTIVKLEGDDAKPVEVKARIVADRRSNSLVVTATEESFAVIESLIEKLDQVPAASPLEYRIITLKHALAADVSYTLRQFTRTWRDGDVTPSIDSNRVENQIIVAATADQIKEITRILDELDQPAASARITDFVALKFAKAEQVQEALSMFFGPYAVEADTPGKRNVRIVADPATNSLVISAGETEWESVRALLAKLDSEDYDSSLQLKIMPLTYADAASVARAINDAFAGELERARAGSANRDQQRPAAGGSDQQQPVAPAVLIQSEQWVRASAETQTNSVIVSASRQNMQKVEQIVKELDVADFASLPPPRLIPVKAGDPAQLAQSLLAMYSATTSTSGGRRAVRIVGDATSNTIIVRAADDEFTQIRALAEALQQEASTQGLSVHVIPVKSMPAARVAASITDAFSKSAAQLKQPLSIQVDAQGNNLIVAATGSLIDSIRATVAELDAMAPGTGQSVFIIELENITPDEAKRVIETIGLDKPQPADAATRLLVEPIKVGVLPGRRAILVVGSPADRDTIVALLKAVDAEPAAEFAEADVRIVRLHHAQAQAMVTLVTQLLGSGPPRRGAQPAVEELVRRLAVRTDKPASTGVFDDTPNDIDVDLTQPIHLVADTTLNAVVVRASEGNAKSVAQLIELLDQLPVTDAVTVQIFPLQNIAAAQFARIVKELFAQGKTLAGVPGTAIKGVPESGVGKALLDEVAIAVDERTNTVIAAGKEETVALVQVLSQRLDSDVATGWVEPRVLPLRYADATSLAATLQQVLVEGQTSLPGAMPLRDTVARLRAVREGEPGEGNQRIVESSIFQPITRLVIRPEPQLNALILVSTPENLELVAELVKMLDVEAASPSAVVRVYPVKFASASRLAGTITQLFNQQVQAKAIRPEDRVVVQADERTNSLVVTTSARSFTVLEELLKVLDAEIAPELREIRMIKVEHASAIRLAEMVQRLMDQRLERLRKVQPDTADLERIAIVPDARTNSLLIAAGNDAFEVIRRLVSDLDQSAIDEQAAVHVIPVSRSNVDRLAAAVKSIMDRRYADFPADVAKAQRPLVLTDSRTNSLLVAASPDDIEVIRQLVARLEEAPVNPAVGLNVITLQSGRAELLAPRLQQLMNERQQSLGGSASPTDRVAIQADIATNSLIVAASDENLEVVRNLIEALASAEGELGPGGAMEIVQLASSRATDMVAMLDDLYVEETNRTRGPNTVRVRADERLNAVVVHAPPADLQAIKRMIAQLDGTRPSQVVEIKYIPLASANALETVSLIENVLSGRGIDGRRTGQQATVLKYLREIAKADRGARKEGDHAKAGDGDQQAELSEMEVSAAIRQSITLTPDMRTNTVIVSAPSISMPMIEQMIRDLDTSNIGAQNIRIFKLKNADAIAMADILTQLFNLSQRGNLYVLKPRDPTIPTGPSMAAPIDGAAPALGAPAPAATAGLSGTELTTVEDVRQQLSITVDSRTNSLLVSGTPIYLDLVERVVNELDQQEANERETFLYQLRNSSAQEVATVLSAFVEQEQRKLIETLSVDQLGSAARLLEREVTIVGDAKSNSVLVSASPRYLDRVKQMIEELDVDPPQVLIQVLLAEVTIDRESEFGVNANVRFNLDNTLVRGRYGLASLFGSAGAGVPAIAINATDFRLIIRAMEAQGRLQVLSNPTIMAVNNVPARIQVGETIRLPESTSFDQGSQQSSVVPEDIGVILEVTPSVNPDGFVRMEIHPEISELSARTTQISEDFESPIITRRTASTTVTVKDGQTVIIGGLISDRYERRDQRVPILGEIPIVGALFRSQQLSSAKTELLIVLTPHVVVSPAEVGRHDAQRLTDEEIDRLSLPQELKDEIRRGSFDPATVRDLAQEMYRQDKKDAPNGDKENKEKK